LRLFFSIRVANKSTGPVAACRVHHVEAAHRRISVAVVRSNAHVHSCLAQQVGRAGNRSVLPGSDVPVVENVD
jgi:hypothetical protein